MIGTIGATLTVLCMVAFAGITWMAYSPRFRKKHEQDAMIPFLDSSLPPELNSDDQPRI